MVTRASRAWLLIAMFGVLTRTWAQAVPVELPESLQARSQDEVVRGAAVEAGASVVFMFRKGPESYVTLRPEAVGLLVSHPSIQAPPGLKAAILSLKAVPVQVSDGDKTGEGFSAHCKVRISASDQIAPGDYKVVVELSDVAEVASLVEASSPLVPPKYVFSVKVWESESARDRVREEARQAAAQKAAEEKQARETALAEATRAGERRTETICAAVAAVLAVLIVGARLVPWWFPKHRLSARRGGAAAISGQLTREKTIEDPKNPGDPEVIFESRQARSFLGRKVDVSVTTKAVSATSTIKTWRNEQTSDGVVQASWLTYSVEYTYSLVIDASVGFGVPAGRYLAKTVSGYCSIRVS